MKIKIILSVRHTEDIICHKVRDRGMLNPHWVAEQRKGVLEAVGIKSAEAYAKKHRFDLPDAA